jgi:hypothetical protein
MAEEDGIVTGGVRCSEARANVRDAGRMSRIRAGEREPTLLVFVGDKDGVMGVDGAVESRAVGILGWLHVLRAPSA